MKLSPDQVEVSGPTIPDIKPDEIMNQTKCLELDRKKEVLEGTWDQALVCGIFRLSMQVISNRVHPIRGFVGMQPTV